jgi:SAM-dependent methyltransferase
MERIIYDRMAELDTRHWWYRARRDVLRDVIAREVRLPKDARILEVGCGTGHNLGMLAGFGAVDAVELDAAARAVAGDRLGRPVIDARLPELEGIETGAYALVAALDVVEHVGDDVAALKGLARCLAPGGRILITVPAFPFLWSGHDVANHHFRRYTRASLRKAIADAGLKIEMLSWFNSLLFPLAIAQRTASKLAGKEGSDDALPPAPLNAAFETIFRLERYLVGRVPLPPGVSLVAILSA